jgi:hypothetical protein
LKKLRPELFVRTFKVTPRVLGLDDMRIGVDDLIVLLIALGLPFSLRWLRLLCRHKAQKNTVIHNCGRGGLSGQTQQIRAIRQAMGLPNTFESRRRVQTAL